MWLWSWNVDQFVWQWIWCLVWQLDQSATTARLVGSRYIAAISVITSGRNLFISHGLRTVQHFVLVFLLSSFSWCVYWLSARSWSHGNKNIHSFTAEALDPGHVNSNNRPIKQKSFELRFENWSVLAEIYSLDSGCLSYWCWVLYIYYLM